MRRIYTLAGMAAEDFTASNNRIASNFFKRLNTQRCTYSLGNGVTFNTEGVKEKLGDKFDTDLYLLAYAALEHGVSFGFWNVDRLHIFKLTEFVPLWDESDGSLRAGIRYWSIDWKRKPVFAVLYEEDGYTKFRSRGKSGLMPPTAGITGRLARPSPRASFRARPCGRSPGGSGRKRGKPTAPPCSATPGQCTPVSRTRADGRACTRLSASAYD